MKTFFLIMLLIFAIAWIAAGTAIVLIIWIGTSYFDMDPWWKILAHILLGPLNLSVF